MCLVGKSHFLMGLHFAFWAKTQSILGQNASHFGPKRLPFWAKTRSILGQTFSILRQNATHFAAKRNPFCGKMQPILRQNASVIYLFRFMEGANYKLNAFIIRLLPTAIFTPICLENIEQNFERIVFNNKK